MDAEAYADMLPWLVFVVTDRRLGLGVAWAAGGALICSAGLVAWSYWRGRYAPLPRIAVGIFTVCLVPALVLPAWNDQVSLPRALVVATLSLLAFGSLRFTPLSETYTVPIVAPWVRDDPRFHKVNVDMTLAWGVGSLAVALACGTTELVPGRLSLTLLDWVTPLVLATLTILWAARRWELFRLAVDAVPDGRHAGDATVRSRSASHDMIGFLGRRAQPARGLPPLELAKPLGSQNPAREASPAPNPDPAGDGGRSAVIRQLPVRDRNVGAAGAD
jgi:hypothetical protein